MNELFQPIQQPQYQDQQDQPANRQQSTPDKQRVQAQLLRFFNHGQHARFTPLNNNKPRYDILPFGQSLFSPVIKLAGDGGDKIGEGREKIAWERNSRYFFNVIMFLWPYFRNRHSKFLVFVSEKEEGSTEQRGDSSLETPKKIRCRRRVVDMGYFVESLVEAILVQHNKTSHSQQITQPSVIRDILEQCLLQPQKQDLLPPATTLLINRLFSLPQKYMTLTLQQSCPSHVKAATSNYQKLEKIIKAGLIHVTIGLLHRDNCQIVALDCGILERNRSLIVYLLNKVIVGSVFNDCRQPCVQVWRGTLFGQEGVDDQERNLLRRFIIRNFEYLLKPYKLVEILFYIWVAIRGNENGKSNIKIDNTVSNMAKQFILEILRYNPNIKKQFYYIVESSSALGQTKLKPSHYKYFYQLLIEVYPTKSDPKQLIIDQSHSSPNQTSPNYNPSSPQSYTFYTLSCLSHWWSLSNDSMLPKKSRQFRYNLLACIIQNLRPQTSNNDPPQQSLLDLNSGMILAQLSQGVEKRLLDSKAYPAAVLIWSKLALKLGLKLDSDMTRLAKYFQDQMETKQVKQVNMLYQRSKHGRSLTRQKQGEKQQDQGGLQKQFIAFNDGTLLGMAKEAQQDPSGKNLYLSQDDDEQQRIADARLKPSTHVTSPKREDQSAESQQETVGPYEMRLKPPQTLYDCILALQNPIRRKVGYQQLLKILDKRDGQVVFVWKQLLRQLLSPIQEQSTQVLIKLMLLRPQQWIKDVGSIYNSKKQPSMNQTAIFIKIIDQGISQLGQNPKHYLPTQVQPPSKQFYFKRVASKYYTQKPVPQKKQPQQTRRWGHTRIAHQSTHLRHESTQPALSLLLIHEPYINNLHQVVSELFFSIVSPMCNNLASRVVRQPITGQHLLVLLGTICEQIKNHFQKYVILESISETCLACVTVIESVLAKQRQQQKDIQASKNKQKPTFLPVIANNQQPTSTTRSLSPLVFSLVQVMNKLTLAVDKNMPELMYALLKETVLRLKTIDMYGIRPLVQMIQANVYRAVSGGI